MSAQPLLVIPHETPLLEGRLLRRYNRFLADIDLPGVGIVAAHCVNTGCMEGLVRPGARVWVSHHPSPSRKLVYTWEMVEVDGVLVGANTAMPNRFVRRLIEARLLRGLSRFDEVVAERRYGTNSRVDFWLRKGRSEHFVEVKNCHLVYPDGRGYFPDSVSERASKHLEELIDVVRSGHRATVLFTIQRPDARAIRPSDVHDPVFAETARRAHAAGVAFRALLIVPTREGYIVDRQVPVDSRPYGLRRQRRWREQHRAFSGWERVSRKSQ